MPRLARALHIHPQRTAIGGQTSNVHEHEAVPGKQPGCGGHRVVAQMFVINRVELAVIDEIPNIGDFDDGNTGVAEENPDPVDDTRQIRNVRKHVVCVNHVGLMPFRQRFGKLTAEKVLLHRTPACRALSAASEAGSIPRTGMSRST